MSAVTIPEVKAAVERTDRERAHDLAERALEAGTGTDVLRLLDEQS